MHSNALHPTSSPVQPARKRLAARFLATVAIALGALALVCTGAQGQSLHHVTYVGGTALTGTNLHGRLSVTSSSVLQFQGASTLNISYGRILSFEPRSHRKVPVGLLAEGLWRLVAPWPEIRQLSISFRDADDHPQIAVLELSRGDENLLVEVLKNRVPRPEGQPPISLRRPSASPEGKLTYR